MSKKIIFKPWGELEWLFSKTENKVFDLIASLSTEDRCLTTFEICEKKKRLGNIIFLEIIDPINTSEHDKLRAKNRLKVVKHLHKDIYVHQLLEPVGTIISRINNFISSSNGNIIVDISSFPKRFFFPIIKTILRSDKIKNLVVTCTTPLEYASENLSENPIAWTHIPTFIPDDPDQKIDIAIVGIGFMPLGLPELLKDKYSQLSTKFLFPFPPGPPNYQRTWQFANNIHASTQMDVRQIIRVDSLDLSETFDRICSLTDKGLKSAILAPYGPKTISLAMCIYSCLTQSAVYYTQPTSYAPDYSTGVDKCYGYIIKNENELYYSL